MPQSAFFYSMFIFNYRVISFVVNCPVPKMTPDFDYDIFVHNS
eukprot:UN03633